MSSPETDKTTQNPVVLTKGFFLVEARKSIFYYVLLQQCPVLPRKALTH